MIVNCTHEFCNLQKHYKNFCEHQEIYRSEDIQNDRGLYSIRSWWEEHKCHAPTPIV